MQRETELAPLPRVTRQDSRENKDDVEAREQATLAASSLAASAAAAADQPIPPIADALAAAADGGERDDASSNSDSDDDPSSGPTAAEVYARPLLYYKRAVAERRRRRGRGRGDPDAAHASPDQGPTQLLLPDGGMCLGFAPVKPPPAPSRRRGRDGGAAGAAAGVAAGGGARAAAGLDADGDFLDNVVVFTSPSADQLSRASLWERVLLFFLLPADLCLVTTIYFLGGPALESSSGDSIASSGGELLTFLLALVALALCVVAMRLRDARMLTVFVVLYYVDALLSLVRIASILQLVQFLTQIAVCHVASMHKQAILPVWWVAEN